MKNFLLDTKKQKILQELENNLNKYEKIFLISDLEHEKLNLIIDYLEMKRKPRGILVLSSTIPESDGRTYSVQKIAKEEEQMILSLYRIYDFSDKFCLIDNDPCTGNIFNYVKNGWLTLEEAMKAMLDL